MAAQARIWEVTAHENGNLAVSRTERPPRWAGGSAIHLSTTAKLMFIDTRCLIVDSDPQAEEWDAVHLLNALLVYRSCDPSASGGAVLADAVRALDLIQEHEPQLFSLMVSFMQTHPVDSEGQRSSEVNDKLVTLFRQYFCTEHRMQGTPKDLTAFLAARSVHGHIRRLVVDVTPMRLGAGGPWG